LFTSRDLRPSLAGTSAVNFTERNRFAEGNHAGMIDASIGAPRRMAGYVPVLPNAVAVGV